MKLHTAADASIEFAVFVEAANKLLAKLGEPHGKLHFYPAFFENQSHTVSLTTGQGHTILELEFPHE